MSRQSFCSDVPLSPRGPMTFTPAVGYPEVNVEAPGWIRKMRTVFRRLDTNGHGYLGDQVVQNMVHLWYGVICTIGEEHTRTNAQLNEPMFIEAMSKCINTTFKEEFKTIMVDTFFDLVDTDHDGLIALNEFVGIIDAWRGNPKEAELIFRLVDNNNDKDKKGKMSKEQFEGVIAQYFFNEDIKVQTVKLWGALINYKRPEDYPECECGPTWEGKMRTMFRRLDINQAGKLRCHDFIQIGRSLAARNHLVKHKADALMRSMLDIWVHYFSVDKDTNHFNELTEKQFIHNMRDMINGDFRHQIDQFGWTFFKAVDIEGTGYISMTEYRNLQEAWHVGRGEAEGMFKVLDTDKDGKISSDEYLSAWVEYFLGEDHNSPYKTFFGPVIFKPAQGQ
ncbi:unnamed protein product [Dibothriocephalus latus]|uniref:EF-hand domain-containing protein n=1 Tax=Dibothriocephalus latus TaxID=60516 RepID=A0A3P6TXB3_DIBLA|nr:unnamed protein product [Dibothriocephalus latus]